VKRWSRLAQYPACPALGDADHLLHVLDRTSSPGRAQKLPSAASFNTLMSTAYSATIFFSRVFSFSSVFSRFN